MAGEITELRKVPLFSLDGAMSQVLAQFTLNTFKFREDYKWVEV